MRKIKKYLVSTGIEPFNKWFEELDWSIQRLNIGGITMRRTPSYNEDLSHRLRRPQYAQEFIASLMMGEDGLSAEDALRQTIQIMGVKEFAEATGVPSSNIVSFVKGRRSLSRIS